MHWIRERELMIHALDHERDPTLAWVLWLVCWGGGGKDLRPFCARVGAAAARFEFADGELGEARADRAFLHKIKEVEDANTLRIGETLYWKGPGPTPALWPCIPATLEGIHTNDPETPLVLRTDDGRDHRAAIKDVGRVPARRQVACVVCARRNWKGPDRFKLVRLWNTRAQRGREPQGDAEAEAWRKDEQDNPCAYDPTDERAQREIARMLCPSRYHDRHPNIPLAELVRSCVRVPWGTRWGGWYEPPKELAEFAPDLAGGAPLLLHRRRVSYLL